MELHRLATAAMLAVVLVGVASPVAAQSVQNTTNATGPEATPEPEAPEQIGQHVVLYDAEYDEDRGVIRVVLESDDAMAVRVADAGGFQEGGEIATNTVALKPGERRTVTVQATKVQGFVGVSIATDDVLYAVPLEAGGSLIGGPYSSGDVQTAGAAGLVSGLALTGMIAYRRVSNTSSDVERVV